MDLPLVSSDRYNTPRYHGIYSGPIPTMDSAPFSLPRYHESEPQGLRGEGGDFTLTPDLMMTYTNKLTEGRRELILRGNNLQIRMGRRLCDEDMPDLCQFLSSHPEVICLDLAYNQLTDKGLADIADHLKDHHTLETLNVMCNDIGSPGMEGLARLGEELSLKSLRVNGNKFGKKGGKALALLLGCNDNLRHLDVGETDQEVSSLVYFTTMLRCDRGGNALLQILDLSRPLGFWNYRVDSAHLADTIGQMLQQNHVLREIHLQKYGFSDHDVELLCHGLVGNLSLRLLDLSCNRIGCDGAKHLGGYLLLRPRLLGLVLAHNQIKNTGARSLSFALPLSRVKLLDVSYNKMDDDGLLDILNSLKKPVMMETLYVWGNKITHKSCWTIRRMLLSGVLTQDRFDLRVYRVDREMKVAHNHMDRYTHLYYCVGDYGHPPPRTHILPAREPAIPTQLTVDHVPCFKVQPAAEGDESMCQEYDLMLQQY